MHTKRLKRYFLSFSLDDFFSKQGRKNSVRMKKSIDVLIFTENSQCIVTLFLKSEAFIKSKSVEQFITTPKIVSYI